MVETELYFHSKNPPDSNSEVFISYFYNDIDEFI